MKTYSTTQVTNLGKVIGAVLLVSGNQVDDSSIEGFFIVSGAIISAISTGWNWLHRYKKGDITIGGFRKGL